MSTNLRITNFSIIALTTVASIAISASAQSTRKPSGDIRSKSVQTQTAAQPATPAKKVIPPPDITEQAETADAVRQDMGHGPIGPPTQAVSAMDDAAPQVTATPEAPVVTEHAPTVAPAQVPILAVRPADSKVLLPVGTAIRMKLDNAISTRDTQPGETFSGKVSEDVVIEGKTVIPTGSRLTGRVTRLFEPRRIAGRPAIQLVPETVVIPGGTTLNIAAVIVDTGDPKKLHVNEEGRIKGPGRNQQDKIELVVGTAAGTVAGTVISPGAGTLVGAAAGATFATANWLIRRHSLELPAGTELIMEISNPVEAPTSSAPAVAQGGN